VVQCTAEERVRQLGAEGAGLDGERDKDLAALLGRVRDDSG